MRPGPQTEKPLVEHNLPIRITNHKMKHTLFFSQDFVVSVFGISTMPVNRPPSRVIRLESPPKHPFTSSVIPNASVAVP